MGQSASLYRVSSEVFSQLEISRNKQGSKISSFAKDYAIAQGSFMAIEFLLSKIEDPSAVELAGELFNPKQALCGDNFDDLTMEEQMDLFEKGGIIPYLTRETVHRINLLLDKFSESYLHEKYDPKELNASRIYPEIWHDDNSPDLAFNEQHIQDDMIPIKKIFKDAAKDEDYILVFVG